MYIIYKLNKNEYIRYGLQSKDYAFSIIEIHSL